jgi:hypothetical protein
MYGRRAQFRRVYGLCSTCLHVYGDGSDGQMPWSMVGEEPAVELYPYM